MDHFTCALLGLIHFPPKTSHLGDPMHIFTFLCIRDDQFSKNLNFTTEGALKSKKLRKETMLEIEKYIKKHVGRKVLLTLTFSPSPKQYGCFLDQSYYSTYQTRELLVADCVGGAAPSASPG